MTDGVRRFKPQSSAAVRLQNCSALIPRDLYTLQEIYQQQLLVPCHHLDTDYFTAVFPH